MLSVENIDVFYGDAQALDGVSLTVEEGSIVAIVGANGAGKTSLIRTIAGMNRPARGTIRYRGSDIAGLPSHKVCNLGIGQVAEGRQVFPTLTVAENLDMGAYLRTNAAVREGLVPFDPGALDEIAFDRNRSLQILGREGERAHRAPDLL